LSVAVEGAAQDDAESLRMQRGAGDPGVLEPVSLSLGGGRRGLASIDGAFRRGDAAAVQSKRELGPLVGGKSAAPSAAGKVIGRLGRIGGGVRIYIPHQLGLQAIKSNGNDAVASGGNQ
jgi:hypothetical protein